MGWFGTRRAQGLGAEGERLAAAHLEQVGLTVAVRNYRGARGEIDLICQDGEVWVFVEVKARSRNDFGGAAFSVPRAKQQQVAKVARHFLVAKGLYNAVPCRFDVVLVDASTAPYGVTHLVDAFRAE